MAWNVAPRLSRIVFQELWGSFMVLIGDEQDTKHKEAMDAARDATVKNDFILYFSCSPVALW